MTTSKIILFVIFQQLTVTGNLLKLSCCTLCNNIIPSVGFSSFIKEAQLHLKYLEKRRYFKWQALKLLWLSREYLSISLLFSSQVPSCVNNNMFYIVVVGNEILFLTFHAISDINRNVIIVSHLIHFIKIDYAINMFM